VRIPPVHRQLLRLFWPLAASSVLMGAAEALVSAGLARLATAEVALAAYGAVLAVSLLIEAPVIPLLHAANALVEDRASYRLVVGCMVALAAGCGAVHAAVAFTPLGGAVFARWLHLPAAVAAAAHPAMVAMLPWSPAIAWRRFFQGVLIRRGVTRPVGTGTAVRTTVAALVLLAGLLAAPAAGVAVGGAALGLAVSTEAVYVTVAARAWARRRGGPAWLGLTAGARPLRLGELVRFYLPLALTNVTAFLGRSLTSAELARGLEPVASLAAWPVASATLFLIQSPVTMTQQLVIAAPAGAGPRQLHRFTLAVGAAATAVIALLLPGGLAVYLNRVMGTHGRVLALGAAALAVLAPVPLATAQQQYWQGRLVARRATRAIIAGAAANLATLAAAGLWGVAHLPWPAVEAVAGATLLGFAAELGVLAVANRSAAPTLAAPVTG
jgi:hypothetical protein